MRDFTLIVPYYRNPLMLARQAEEWAEYPDDVRVIVVDDGSPEPADEIIPTTSRASILRIDVDIPWNRNGARNLGAMQAETQWLLQIDIDHILPIASARWLIDEFKPNLNYWYRFKRYRVGQADETRQKDAIAPTVTFGEIKPHIDSYLCRKELYWAVGGYDEDFSGSLGGSAPFLAKMKAKANCRVLGMPLHVYTRDAIADASDTTLSRDRERFAKLRAEKRAQGDPKPTDWLRFPWRQIR